MENLTFQTLTPQKYVVTKSEMTYLQQMIE